MSDISSLGGEALSIIHHDAHLEGEIEVGASVSAVKESA